MLRPFAHPAACCWVLLGVVAQSLKPVKRLSNNWNNIITTLTNKSYWPDSRQILRHQSGFSLVEAQPLYCKKFPAAKSKERWRYSQANLSLFCLFEVFIDVASLRS